MPERFVFGNAHDVVSADLDYPAKGQTPTNRRCYAAIKPRYKQVMKINAIIWQEDGVWCGSVPALPGCHTWGETREQLTEMLTEAVEGWLEVANA